MTTILAVATEAGVLMAADSMTNVYDRPIPGAVKKIRRIKVGTGEALFAVCGVGGLAAAADHLDIDTEPDLGDEDAVQSWANEIAASVQLWAAQVGLVNEGRMDGSILFAWRDRLWTISEVQAIPHPDRRAALGSGEGPALGAFDALVDVAGLKPHDAVYHAMRIAIDRDRNSGDPIQIELLPASETDI